MYFSFSFTDLLFSVQNEIAKEYNRVRPRIRLPVSISESSHRIFSSNSEEANSKHLTEQKQKKKESDSSSSFFFFLKQTPILSPFRFDSASTSDSTRVWMVGVWKRLILYKKRKHIRNNTGKIRAVQRLLPGFHPNQCEPSPSSVLMRSMPKFPQPSSYYLIKNADIK